MSGQYFGYVGGPARAQYDPQPYTPHPKEGPNEIRTTSDQALFGPYLRVVGVWLGVVLGSMIKDSFIMTRTRVCGPFLPAKSFQAIRSMGPWCGSSLYWCYHLIRTKYDTEKGYGPYTIWPFPLIGCFMGFRTRTYKKDGYAHNMLPSAVVSSARPGHVAQPSEL